MGITGLLPLLKSIHKPCELKKFAGQTIGVDAYGWLHRGTVTCATEIALGKPTRRYVDFSMHRVRMLRHFGVEPLMVFDGDYLPSKAATEHERAQKREENKRKGLEFHRLGKATQRYFEKSVDVTPEMAGQLIEELKLESVQYIVAPYEADAQLVYLERIGYINGIISEDSDLLVFGAKWLLTKLDKYGSCVAINRADFTACKDICLVGWSDADFRRMAILSGCDYLPSMNKMGLKTAHRLVRKYKTIERIVKAVQLDGQLKVPFGYIEAFAQADLTFRHQRVFCPTQRKIVLHTELEGEMDEDSMSFIGQDIPADIAIGIACGDLHPMTKLPLIVDSGKRTKNETPRIAPKQRQNKTFPLDSENLKWGKPIDKFFKSTRTPLGELDPNSFTPSPSQQRVLRQNRNTSWTSSPLAERSNTTQISSIDSTSTPHSAPAPAPTSRTVSWTKPVSAPRPPKRPRLCSDEQSKLFNSASQRADLELSPFFSSPAVPSSPSVATNRRTKKKKVEFNIFSDDSIEDVMAGLPDISESREPPKAPRPTIFEDEPDIRPIADGTSPDHHKHISRTPTPSPESPPTLDACPRSDPSAATVVLELPSGILRAQGRPESCALSAISSYRQPVGKAHHNPSQYQPNSALLATHTVVSSKMIKTARNLRAQDGNKVNLIQGSAAKEHREDVHPSSPVTSSVRPSSIATSKRTAETCHTTMLDKAPVKQNMVSLASDLPSTFKEKGMTKERLQTYGGSEDQIVADSEEEEEDDEEALTSDDYDERKPPVALDIEKFMFRANASN
ncbi:MAG: Rad2 nuclease [Sclerophora amabilis]|nr:MAG: Rad2 nuclease [Sclerophora amabilis]